ncbi:MAG TPA: cytochrome c [Ramlibacter sp.]|uniref:cytochrome c n=1 Tax=Ramlibacter sp. TaxID=1917967 RepID=UPI002D809F81|nr:cytochrome c [Ramlibacter sp.]HET8748931.1 cytochrome c [Ramlibacter sp.]
MRKLLAAALAALCALPAAAGEREDRVNEIVLARRNLMAAVGRHMDEIDAMLEPGRQLDPHEASEHADEIAVLLMAFPHLFPAGSNNWSKALEQAEPALVTRAAPAAWKQRRAFEAQARSASQLATDASRAPDADAFRRRAQALEATCEACHQQFRREEKPYSIPIPPHP